MTKTSFEDRGSGSDTQDAAAQATPSAMLVVDFAVRIGGHIYIAGWSGNDVSDIAATLAGAPCNSTVRRQDRPDVSEVYGGQVSPQDLGFVLLVSGGIDGELCLNWRLPQQQAPQTQTVDVLDKDIPEALLRNLELLLKEQIKQLETGSPEWAAHVFALPQKTSDNDNSLGAIDHAFESQGQGSILGGWVICPEAAQLYLMDADKQLHRLENMHRFERMDLAKIPNVSSHQLTQAGFISFLQQPVTAPVRLLVLTEETVTVLGAPVELRPLPADPKRAAQQLFEIGSPVQGFSRRVGQIDWPILSSLIAQQQAQWAQCPVVGEALGPQPEAPKVTLIIPLYGRYDFVEHQLMEFSRDPYMRQQAEILYVIDDPKILVAFQAETSELFQLYGQPFRWVWGGTNRGFSGANNLGVSQANAPRFLFMNSDVFPQGPGWLEQMVTALDDHPNLGMVTPRLLFVNGGMQHAGMESRRLEAIDIWINHHPNLGLDPEFDPRQALEAVPLATGACMLLRRDELARMGGWDTGYLIGDFEDSDLCFKYRSAGFDIGYLPTVALTHLERQSFTQIGADAFKQRVMIANSVRHTGRWPQFLHD